MILNVPFIKCLQNYKIHAKKTELPQNTVQYVFPFKDTPSTMSGRWTPVGVNPIALAHRDIIASPSESLARLISRPDRGRQLTDGCGSLSRCAQIKGGEGLGDEDT
jgi:hypothetical protein